MSGPDGWSRVIHTSNIHTDKVLTRLRRQQGEGGVMFGASITGGLIGPI